MDVSNTETRKIVLYLKTQNGFTNFPYRFSNSISGDEMTIRAYARPPVLLNIDTMITKRWLEASEIILIPDHITRVRYGDCGPILWTKNASDNPTKILNSADFSYLEIKTLNPDHTELRIQGKLKTNGWYCVNHSIDYISDIRQINFYAVPVSILLGKVDNLKDIKFDYSLGNYVNEVRIGERGPTLRIDRTKNESVLRIGEIQ
jgi:hypothetical protein